MTPTDSQLRDELAKAMGWTPVNATEESPELWADEDGHPCFDIDTGDYKHPGYQPVSTKTFGRAVASILAGASKMLEAPNAG